MKYLHEARSLGHALRLSCEHWGDRTSHIMPIEGGRRTITFTELWQIVRTYASAIQTLGLKKGDRICIFSLNSFEWIACDWAALSLGLIPVPIYPTLPSDQAQYIVQNCGAAVVLCGNEQLEDRLKDMTGIRCIQMSAVEGMAPDSFDDASWLKAMEEVERKDTATIIYTSGTTGDPKGAVLTHGGFLTIYEGVPRAIQITENDIFLGFLPLSHVFERANGHLMPTSMGAAVAHCRSMASIGTDLAEVEPTVMLCVPRFLESLRSRIWDAAEKQGGFKAKLFSVAVEQGKAHFLGKPAPFFWLTDKLVGAKVRARVGKRFRFFVSGGAALPVHLSTALGAFGIQTLQGFGLTETTSGICVNRPEKNDIESVGTPIADMEIKIAEDGEILTRGEANMSGYYNLPEETAQAIDADGWFHTGDIGEIKPNGNLKITDRKKDLLILGNGKNVAPQPIENLLRESEYINEAVLFGDGMEAVCALILPDFDRLKTYAAQHGITSGKPEDLVDLDSIKTLLKNEITAVNKTLADFQKVKRYSFLKTTFSIDTGELTPSLKVKRRVVREKYAAEIQAMQRPGQGGD